MRFFLMHSKGESVGREKSGRKEKTSDFKGVLSDFFSKVMKNYYFCKKNRFMVKV